MSNQEEIGDISLLNDQRQRTTKGKGKGKERREQILIKCNGEPIKSDFYPNIFFQLVGQKRINRLSGFYLDLTTLYPQLL